VDLKQLKYFLALANCGSFRVAARECGISQPGLSRQIMALEETIGAPLFDRGGRRATLTPVGERLLPHARRVLKELEQAKSEIAELLRPDRGEITIAGLHSVNTYLLPSLLATFRERFPQTQLRLTSLGSERIVKVLLDRLVDLAVVMGPVTTPELVSTLLYEEDLAILVPAAHPLARQHRATLAQLERYPHVVFREGYAMRTAVDRFFAESESGYEIAVELNTLESFKETVRQGVGIAILPESALQNLGPDLARVDLTPGIRRRVELVCRRDNYQVPVVACFADLLARRLPVVFAEMMGRTEPPSLKIVNG